MSLHDHFALHNRVHSALYGAPLHAAELRLLLNRQALPFPLQVAVADEKNQPIIHEAWCFNPGDELLYITATAKTARSHPQLEWLDAGNPTEWLRAMQQAILRYRQRKSGRFSAVQVDSGNEQRARQLALRQVHLQKPEWCDAVGYWCDIVFITTQNKIHDSQRLIVDFATEAARPLPTLGTAAYRFHFFLQRMLAAYTWQSLHALLLNALELVLEQQKIQSLHIDPRIQRSLRYMQDHLASPLTLVSVATIAQTAPAVLSRMFKQATGSSFTSYLQERRLERSVDLLLRSDRTVLDIAIDSGFGSVEQYHRVFKQAFATTPNRFRRQQKRVIE